MAKLQEKVEPELSACASPCGFPELLCLGSGSCHHCTRGCTTQVSLLLASHGLLGTKSRSGARAASSSFISMSNAVSQADAGVMVAEA